MLRVTGVTSGVDVALVVVQMGHCYRRRGGTGVPGEQLFSRRAADACRRTLTGRDHRVRVIRADDPEGAYGGDVFVAVHCDGSVDPAARGAGVGYESTSGRRIARAFAYAYAAQGWRGFRPDNYSDAIKHYYGLTLARDQGVRYAFVVEAGFLTNPEDRRVLESDAGPAMLAVAVAQAVDQALSLDGALPTAGD